MDCHNILDFTENPSFVAPRYFCSSPPLYFSAFHDRLISTEMPSFPRLRQDNLFLPRCPFLLCLDTFVFTVPPFFCCTAIFLFAPRCLSFGASRYFQICTNSFRSNFANACFSGGATSRSLVLKIMPPSPRPLETVLGLLLI